MYSDLRAYAPHLGFVCYISDFRKPQRTTRTQHVVRTGRGRAFTQPSRRCRRAHAIRQAPRQPLRRRPPLGACDTTRAIRPSPARATSKKRRDAPRPPARAQSPSLTSVHPVHRVIAGVARVLLRPRDPRAPPLRRDRRVPRVARVVISGPRDSDQHPGIRAVFTRSAPSSQGAARLRPGRHRRRALRLPRRVQGCTGGSRRHPRRGCHRAAVQDPSRRSRRECRG